MKNVLLQKKSCTHQLLSCLNAPSCASCALGGIRPQKRSPRILRGPGGRSFLLLREGRKRQPSHLRHGEMKATLHASPDDRRQWLGIVSNRSSRIQCVTEQLLCCKVLAPAHRMRFMLGIISSPYIFARQRLANISYCGQTRVT